MEPGAPRCPPLAAQDCHPVLAVLEGTDHQQVQRSAAAAPFPGAHAEAPGALPALQGPWPRSPHCRTHFARQAALSIGLHSPSSLGADSDTVHP